MRTRAQKRITQPTSKPRSHFWIDRIDRSSTSRSFCVVRTPPFASSKNRARQRSSREGNGDRSRRRRRMGEARARSSTIVRRIGRRGSLRKRRTHERRARTSTRSLVPGGDRLARHRERCLARRYGALEQIINVDVTFRDVFPRLSALYAATRSIAPSSRHFSSVASEASTIRASASVSKSSADAFSLKPATWPVHVKPSKLRSNASPTNTAALSVPTPSFARA